MKQIAIGILTTIGSGLIISLFSMASDVSAMNVKIKRNVSDIKDIRTEIRDELRIIQGKLDKLNEKN